MAGVVAGGTRMTPGGVGPTRRRALIKHFGSLDAIRVATVDEIANVPGIPHEVAIAIKEHL